MTPIILLVAIFLLIRGHDAPGGGFIAGLMAAMAFCLYTLAFGIEPVKEALHIAPKTLLGFGVLTALLSGMFSWFFDVPYLTGIWAKLEVPQVGWLKVGTPSFFDVGVFFVVVGMVTSIVMELARE
jgi:multicomponent Na+:H+ antiporter subunit B